MQLRSLSIGSFIAVVACVAGACGSDEDAGANTSALTCVAPPRAPGTARLERAFPNVDLAEPTRALLRNGRWYVVERLGTVRSFEDRDDVREVSTVLDLASLDHLYTLNNDDGLMGLALHPRFEDNGEVFLSYTAPTRADGFVYEYRIDRARSFDGGKTIDPSTLERVLVLPRDTGLHHGGPLAFDASGKLLAAIGDGEFADPRNRAQDLGALFGKVLRIDVDGAKPYAIPVDNPFVARPEVRPEIWALGFRNPFSMYVDEARSDVWVGDVGHVRFEEIDLVRAGSNYGWRIREANQCLGAPECTSEGLTAPEFAYSHGEGMCVITGFVYRGSAFPELRDSLLFGDFITGRVSALRDGAARVVVESGRQISGFAADRDGEMIVVDYGSGTLNRVVPERAPAALPETLSATRCFDVAADVAAPTLFEYDVNMPLWSDGAAKRRWFQLPRGGKVSIGANGAWELPIGAMAFKTFEVDGRKVETRMLVRHETGDWGGYTYAWNEDGSDAVLLSSGVTRDLGNGRTWTYPSRSDCFACHNVGAGRTLGLTTAQLDRDGQIERLAQAGVFDETVGDEIVPKQLDAPDRDSIEWRARQYLVTNCSTCHRPDAPASGLGDFTGSVAFDQMDVCNIYVSTGEDAVRLAPGDANASAIIQRMRAHDGRRMPPLGVSVPDEEGIAWVSAWIDAIPKELCPVPTRPFVQ